ALSMPLPRSLAATQATPPAALHGDAPPAPASPPLAPTAAPGAPASPRAQPLTAQRRGWLARWFGRR
ncbi:MAG TPA: hypothetical protein VGR57_10135, partial [Ktedonobacterales bacterium]|nr:hypothetical protein [Ktedonobacterales bacterium]